MEQLSRVDVQQDCSSITGLCMKMTHLQQQLSSMGPISDHTKWLLNLVLEQSKQELTSMTSRILRLRTETDELTKHLLSAQSRLEAFKLDIQTKEKQITELEQTKSFLIASKLQLKNDLMAVYQSKNKAIAELAGKIAKTNERNLSSKIVGFERKLRTGSPNGSGRQNNSREEIPSSSNQTSGEFLSAALNETNSYQNPVMQDLKSSPMSCLPEQDPVTLHPHTNTWRLTSESVETAAERTRDREQIPVSDFVVISEVGQIEQNNKLMLTNIPNCDYGRVVGREGRNVKRLRNKYGVGISFIDCKKEYLRLIISGADAENRRAAANDITGNLPIVVACPNLKLEISNQQIKQINYDYHVQLIQPAFGNNGHVTIRGRMDNCRIVYRLLANDTKLWYPK